MSHAADSEVNSVIKAVIFDLDGTLLNSRKLRIEAWKHAFSVYGVELSDEKIDPLIGLPGPDLAGKFSSKAFEIEMEEERYFRKNLDRLELYEDALPTIEKLNSLGIRTGVVTSSRRAMLDIIKLPIEPVVTIDDVEVGKPDPESYLKILRILDVKPENGMFVGDAETDLIPANEIGSLSVFIKHGRELESDYADHYIDEISDVLKLLDRLNSRPEIN